MEFTKDMFSGENIDRHIEVAKLRLDQEPIESCTISCIDCPLNYNYLCRSIINEACVVLPHAKEYIEVRDGLLKMAYTKFLEFYDKPKPHHINFMEE